MELQLGQLHLLLFSSLREHLLKMLKVLLSRRVSGIYEFNTLHFIFKYIGMNIGIILGSSLLLGGASGYLVADAKLKECSGSKKPNHFGKFSA